MATRRSTRVTNVDPWIVGGEGQLRDLFPLPPWLLIVGRALSTAAKHFLVTLVIITALWLWIFKDWGWFPAFVLFPITFYLIRSTLLTSWLWFKNPTIPLIARK